MIVVVGDPILHPSDGRAPALAGGPAASIARACALAGAAVQLAGKIGDDPAGDEVLLCLNRDGIGHVALLRDAGLLTRIGPTAGPATGDEVADEPALDQAWAVEADDAALPLGDPAAAIAPPLSSALAPEDLDLALRYLVTFAVVVVAEPLAHATLTVAAEAAAFSGAHLVIVGPGTGVPPAAAERVTVLEPPAADPDDEFTGLVARYAVALDGGATAAAAFRVALGDTGWESAAS